MDKVTTINLAGNAFQLEDAGFVKLSAYLADARKKLAGNPDLEEIISDFEAALAQKCRAYLNDNKTVVMTEEVEKIISDMGPVEGNTEASNSQDKDAPKRLYRVMEGSMILGVCNGLAAYFNVDVTLVRVAFVLLSILSSGVWILAYIVLAVILPVAGTPEEQSAAYGTPPITAQRLIDRAKEGYENFQNSREWREWKQQFRQETRKWKHEQHRYWREYQYQYHRRSPFWEFMHSLLGMAWTLLIIVGLWYAYHHSLVAKEYLDLLGGWIGHALHRILG